MKTYNTYQEAKIANPNRDIYYTMIANGGKDAVFGLFEDLNKFTDVIHKCKPDDHCVTVEKFLDDGHKFVDGDILLFPNAKKQVEVVGGNGSMVNVISANHKSMVDHEIFILRAAALEQPKPTRTKVSYEKVTNSIFDLKEEFERGELYQLVGKSEYRKINNTECLAACLKYGSAHRKVETTITEREAFIEEAVKVWVKNDSKIIGEIFGDLFDSGKFKLTDKD